LPKLPSMFNNNETSYSLFVIWDTENQESLSMLLKYVH